MSKKCHYGVNQQTKKCAVGCKKSVNGVAVWQPRNLEGKCTPKDFQTLVYDYVGRDIRDEDLTAAVERETGYGTINVAEAVQEIIRVRGLEEFPKQRRHSGSAEAVLAQPAVKKPGRILPWLKPKTKKAPEENVFDDNLSPRNKTRHIPMFRQRSPEQYSSSPTPYSPVFHRRGSMSISPGIAAPSESPRVMHGPMPAPMDESPRVMHGPMPAPTKKAKVCPPPDTWVAKTSKIGVCAQKCPDDQDTVWTQENGKWRTNCDPKCPPGYLKGKDGCAMTKKSCKDNGQGYSKTHKRCVDKKGQNAEQEEGDDSFVDNAAEERHSKFEGKEPTESQKYSEKLNEIFSKTLNGNQRAALLLVQKLKNPENNTAKNNIMESSKTKKQILDLLVEEKVYDFPKNMDNLDLLRQDFINAFDVEMEEHPLAKIYAFCDQHNLDKDNWKVEIGRILESISDDQYAAIHGRIQTNLADILARIETKQNEVVEGKESLSSMPENFLRVGDSAYHIGEDGEYSQGIIKSMFEDSENQEFFTEKMHDKLVGVGDVVLLFENNGHRQYGVVTHENEESGSENGTLTVRKFKKTITKDDIQNGNEKKINATTKLTLVYEQPVYPEDEAELKKKELATLKFKIPRSKRWGNIFQMGPVDLMMMDAEQHAVPAGIVTFINVMQILWEDTVEVDPSELIRLTEEVYKTPYIPLVEMNDFSDTYDAFVNTKYFRAGDTATDQTVSGKIISVNKKNFTAILKTSKGEKEVPLRDLTVTNTVPEKETKEAAEAEQLFLDTVEGKDHVDVKGPVEKNLSGDEEEEEDEDYEEDSIDSSEQRKIDNAEAPMIDFDEMKKIEKIKNVPVIQQNMFEAPRPASPEKQGNVKMPQFAPPAERAPQFVPPEPAVMPGFHDVAQQVAQFKPTDPTKEVKYVVGKKKNKIMPVLVEGPKAAVPPALPGIGFL